MRKISYSEGFLRVWDQYPHHEFRSKKPLAWVVWERDSLEEDTEQVLKWVYASRKSDEWRKDGGQYVQGMQVWLNQTEFSDDPCTVGRKAKQELPPKEKEAKLLEFEQKYNKAKA